ncbi:tetratricopeptide repeat-containing protein [Cystoisospora suis]|uniref:Tetratricopeptide repeat-containing protein n=1 Tax=Cystoisospora suis TaxID=483139 RepID=A0A2C6KZA9_9APIC|nr:tetratricopeptide repeat-containing protein [Cystoisospora suis]
MEEEATKIMSAYCSGDYAAVEGAFKGMDQDLVKHAVNRARELGNSAFSKKNYKEAIQYYNEALAGEEPSKKHLLVSNRSACHFQLKDYNKALEDARLCIQLKQDWAKGWFRAARVLFATGKYSGAVSAFKVSRRHETDQLKVKELDDWINKAELCVQKAKIVERVSVDYKRFDDIEDPDEAALEGEYLPTDDPAGCGIEFSEHLSEKQKRDLEMFLTGKPAICSSGDSQIQSFSFSPSSVFTEAPDYLELLRRTKKTLKRGGKTKGGLGESELKKQQIIAEAPVALCRYLQLTTELREPKRLAESMNTRELISFTEGLEQLIRRVPENEQLPSWLFLGTGTCLPLVKAAQLLKQRFPCSFLNSTPPAHSEPAGDKDAGQGPAGVEDPDQQATLKSVNCRPITACPIFLSQPLGVKRDCAAESLRCHRRSCGEKSNEKTPEPGQKTLADLRTTGRACFGYESVHTRTEELETAEKKASGLALAEKSIVSTGEATKQMLEKNGVAPVVNVVRQPLEMVECAEESSDLLDLETKEISRRAEMLVIDLSVLDEGFLGRRVVPKVRFARTNLCVKNPIVYPSSATVYVQAFSIALPETTTGYKWSAVETAARWNPYADPMVVRPVGPQSTETSKAGGHSWSYGDVAVALSEPQAVFHFRFDGPLESLDQDLPLHGAKDLELACSHSGSLNAIVAWYQLLSREVQGCSAGHGDAETLVIDGAPIPHSERDRDTACHHPTRSGLWKQAVFWVDPLPVTEGQTLAVQASHTSSRLRFKLVSPSESPTRTQQVAVARYHLDLLRDPGLLSQAAFGRIAQSQLKKIRQRMSKYEQLSASADATDLPATPPLSVVCVGGAPAPLPFLMGHGAALEIVRMEGRDASAWHRQQSRIQKYQLTVVDPWPGIMKTCKKVARENAELLLEQSLAPSLLVAKEDKWKPVSDLSAEAAKGTPASLAHQKRATSSGNEKTVKQPCGGSATAAAADNSSDSLLLKSKLKERFTFIEKDVRQLKPPRGEEDSCSLLTLAEILRLPMGTDIQAQLDQADQADPEGAALCRISSPFLICVSGLFDYGCLGEGALPLSKFVARVLMNKRHGVFVPRRARVFAVLVELGSRCLKEINVETWRTYRYMPDYTGINLDEETFTQLCDPFEAWDFDLSQNVLADRSSPLFDRARKEVKVKLTQAGEVNAAVFWFELEVDDSLTISTSPELISLKERSSDEKRTECSDVSSTHETSGQLRTQASEAAEATGHVAYRTKAWRQACQMLTPVQVAEGQSVSVGIAHDSTKILFKVSTEELQEDEEEIRPLVDSTWAEMFDRQRQLSTTWMKALNTSSENAEATGVSEVVRAAMNIATDAGRQQHFLIDPTEAASFALTLFL